MNSCAHSSGWAFEQALLERVLDAFQRTGLREYRCGERDDAVRREVQVLDDRDPHRVLLDGDGSARKVAGLPFDHILDHRIAETRMPLENRGWRRASGSAVAFIDYDCYPEPDLVDRIDRSFEADTGLGFLGGAVLPHDPEDAFVGTVARADRYEIRPGTFIAAGTLITANLAFRRTVLESIGGFDEAFGYGDGLAGEDAAAPRPQAGAAFTIRAWSSATTTAAGGRRTSNERGGRTTVGVARSTRSVSSTVACDGSISAPGPGLRWSESAPATEDRRRFASFVAPHVTLA